MNETDLLDEAANRIIKLLPFEIDNYGYARTEYGLRYRFILSVFGVDIPRGHVVHHKDRNKLNDLPSNLAVITREMHDIEHNGYCSNMEQIQKFERRQNMVQQIARLTILRSKSELNVYEKRELWKLKKKMQQRMLAFEKTGNTKDLAIVAEALK